MRSFLFTSAPFGDFWLKYRRWTVLADSWSTEQMLKNFPNTSAILSPNSVPVWTTSWNLLSDPSSSSQVPTSVNFIQPRIVCTGFNGSNALSAWPNTLNDYIAVRAGPPQLHLHFIASWEETKEDSPLLEQLFWSFPTWQRQYALCTDVVLAAVVLQTISLFRTCCACRVSQRYKKCGTWQSQLISSALSSWRSFPGGFNWVGQKT